MTGFRISTSIPVSGCGGNSWSPSKDRCLEQQDVGPIFLPKLNNLIETCRERLQIDVNSVTDLDQRSCWLVCYPFFSQRQDGPPSFSVPFSTRVIPRPRQVVVPGTVSKSTGSRPLFLPKLNILIETYTVPGQDVSNVVIVPHPVIPPLCCCFNFIMNNR